MKLRSIVLTGLLGTSFLAMSGCNSDDIVNAVNNVTKPNAVYVVNGYGNTITAHADSDTATLSNRSVKLFSLSDNGDTDVYYKVGNNASPHTSLAYGNAHLYVASSECNLHNGFGSLTDRSTGNGVVKVVNATNSPLIAQGTNSIVVHVRKNGTTSDTTLTLPSGRAVAGCSQETTTFKIADLGIENGSDVSVTMGGTTSTPYHVNFDVPTTVDVDIVYLGGENAVAVPLAKWDDLI